MLSNAFVSHAWCVQPATVTLRAPSAGSVERSGVSAAVNPTWWGDAATSVLQGPSASERADAAVSQQ